MMSTQIPRVVQCNFIISAAHIDTGATESKGARIRIISHIFQEHLVRICYKKKTVL